MTSFALVAKLFSMMTSDVKLPEDQQALKQLCLSLHNEVDWLKRDINRLEGMLRLSGYLRFGSSSEQMNHPGMKNLFPDSSEGSEPSEEKPVKVNSFDRKSSGRKPIPDHLPREDKLLDLADKKCHTCDQEMKKVGEDIFEKLHYQPPTCVVHRYIKPVYACKCCEAMKTEPMPPHPIPKCSVTPETIAQIAISKYVDSLPLYRQEQIFARHGAEIGRDKMARWLITVSDQVNSIFDLLETELLTDDLIQMDETTVQVLKEKGRLPSSKSYMIVRTREGPPGRSIVLFNYNPSRSKQVMAELVKDFKGILLTDGLEVYGSLCLGREDLIHAGCWSHARRYFIDAQKQLKPSRRQNSIAGQGVEKIDRLFKIERQAKDLSPTERLSLRQKESDPIIKDLERLLNQELANFPKKSETGIALHYLNNQWEKLVKFLGNGRIPLHNNFTENRIRPFTIGRRNWLFSDQPEGAKASAIIYSLLVTAQLNGLNPYDYFCKLLKGIAAPNPDLKSLLPLANLH